MAWFRSLFLFSIYSSIMMKISFCWIANVQALRAEPINQQQTCLLCSCFRCTAQHVHALDADGCAILQELHFLVLSFAILPDAVAYHLKLKGVPKLCFYCREVFWGLYQWGWMVIISYRQHCHWDVITLIYFHRIWY